MTGSVPSRRIARRLSAATALALVAGSAWAMPQAVAADPSLSMTPGPTSHPYANGQNLVLSVGANTRFTPNTRIEVLECAAPKGVLPIDDSTCDGNTAQYGSVLVGPDGSFQVPSYTLYQLPNSVLGEQNNHDPVCNATHECVLYIGQDQNDFSKPKMFSPVFSVGSTSPVGTTPSPSGGSSPTGGSTGHGAGGSTSSTGGTGSVDPSVSLGDPPAGSSGVDPGVSAQAAGTLAFTGIGEVPLLVGVGAILVLLGAAGRNVRRRARP